MADEPEPKTGSLIEELVALAREARGDIGERGAALWARVRRVATWLLGLGAASFLLCITAIAAGPAWLASLGFLGLAAMVFACLLVLAPFGSLLAGAAHRWTGVRLYLRIVAGVLIGFFLLALGVSILPGILQIDRFVPIALAALSAGLAVAAYGIGAGVQRLLVLRAVVVVVVVLKSLVVDVFPQTAEALRAALLRADRYVAWEVATDRTLSPRVGRLALDTLEEVDSTAFFDADGNPLVWYAWRDDRYEFFTTPGIHPEASVTLQPVTPRVVREHRRRLVRDTERASAQEAARQRARRRQELASLFHPPLAASSGDVLVAVAVALETALEADKATATRLLTESMAANTRSNTRLLPAFFEPRFASGGYLRRAFDGGGALLREMGVFAHVDAVVLAVVDGRCDPNPAREDMMVCRLTMRFRSFDEGAGIVDTGSLSVRSAGFTRGGAVERGIELIGERNGARLLAALETDGPMAASQR